MENKSKMVYKSPNFDVTETELEQGIAVSSTPVDPEGAPVLTEVEGTTRSIWNVDGF